MLYAKTRLSVVTTDLMQFSSADFARFSNS